MALGESIGAIVYDKREPRMTGVPVVARWVTIIDNPGVIIVDAPTIQNPDTQIVDPSRHLLVTEGLGTNLLLRIKYTYCGISVGPNLKAFGKNGKDSWSLLRNRFSISGAITDLSDGVSLYTNPVSFPLLGYSQVLIGVEVAPTLATTEPPPDPILSLEAQII